MKLKSFMGRNAPLFVCAGMTLIVLVTSCAQAARNPNHIFYHHGDNVLLESCDIDNDIDTVCKVNSPISSLHGLEVSIPAGTLKGDNTLLISENYGVVDLPFIPGQHRPIISLLLSENDVFGKLVRVTVPVSNPESTYTFFWVEDEKYISVVTSDAPRQDDNQNTVVTFLVLHPGIFSWAEHSGK